MRDRYAFLGAASVTAVIGFTWLVAAYINFGAHSSSRENIQSAAPVFSSFFAGAKEQFGDLKEELQGLGAERDTATTSTTTDGQPPSVDAISAASGATTTSDSTSSTSSTTTTEPLIPDPPPGRSTGREVRIGTSSASSTNR